MLGDIKEENEKHKRFLKFLSGQGFIDAYSTFAKFIRRINEWITFWRATNVINGWETNGLNPISLGKDIEADSHSFGIYPGQTKPLVHTVRHKTSTSLAAALAEITFLTGNIKYILKKAGKIQETYNPEAGIEILASQFLFFFDELGYWAKVDLIYDLIKYLWMCTVDSEFTALAGLCITLIDDEIISEIWPRFYKTIFRCQEVQTIDARITTKFLYQRYSKSNNSKTGIINTNFENLEKIERYNILIILWDENFRKNIARIFGIIGDSHQEFHGIGLQKCISEADRIKNTQKNDPVIISHRIKDAKILLEDLMQSLENIVRYPIENNLENKKIIDKIKVKIKVIINDQIISEDINNKDYIQKAQLWFNNLSNEFSEDKPDSISSLLRTSHWNSNEVKILLEDFPTKNIRMFLHWDDIEDNQRVEKGSIKMLLYTLTRYIDDYKKSDYSIVLDENEPIRIIHFSDMQFGGVDKNAEYLNVNHCADTIKRKLGKGPTFIAITGDITQRGLPEEYDAAYKWLKSLISNFSWSCPSNRVFLVPGNHDICLPLATSSLLKLQKKENKKQSIVEEVVDFIKDRNSPIDSLIDYAMQPYLHFCSKLTNITYINDFEDIEIKKQNRYSYLWLETKFRHLNIVFFGLNSSQPIIPGGLSRREIPGVTVEILISEIKKLLEENSNLTPIFIGLTHHYPLTGKDGDAIDNPDVFLQLFNDIPSVALWLHGHWHRRETTDHPTGNGRLVINSAPTLLVKEKNRPQDTLRGFSMIEIQRKNSKITGCRIYPVEFVNHVLRIREQEGKEYKICKAGYFQEKNK